MSRLIFDSNRHCISQWLDYDPCISVIDSLIPYEVLLIARIVISVGTCHIFAMKTVPP